VDMGPPVAKPSGMRKEIGSFDSSDVVLLQRSEGGWQRVKLDGRVATAEPLLCMPGYKAPLPLDGGGRLLLLGRPAHQPSCDPLLESRLTLHAPAPGVAADFTLETGRVVIQSSNPGPTLVRARFADEVWDVTLQSDETEVVLDLYHSYPYNVAFSKQPGGERP